MMNVKRDATRRAGDPHRCIEQYGRIEAAAVSDRNARVRRLFAKRNADCIEHDAIGGGFSRSIHGESQ
jgi:hypothetical protein